jgi:lipopolysaccharide export system protein LptC
MRHIVEFSRAAAAALALALAFGGVARLSYPSVSVANPAITGTRLTMQDPKYSGYTRDGRRRYELAASSAVQPLQGADGIALDRPRVQLETTKGTKLALSAASGVLAPDMARLALRDDVVLTSDPAHEIHLSEAQIDLRNNTVTSETPFQIAAETGTILAHRLQVSESGTIVVVNGVLIRSGNVIQFDNYALQ